MAFRLDGGQHEIKSWRELLPQLCEQLANGAEAAFVERVTRPEGPSYLRSSVPDSPYWVPIGTTGLYVYVNITGTVAADRARRIVAAVRGSADGFAIESQARTSAPEPASEEPESFAGRSPAAFWLDGARHEVTELAVILQDCATHCVRSGVSGVSESELRLVRGRRRPYFSEQPRICAAASDSRYSTLYVEGNLSAPTAVRVASLPFKPSAATTTASASSSPSSPPPPARA